MDEKLQFWTNFDIWELLYWCRCAKVNPRSTLMCQISSQSVYSVALRWQKAPNFVIFWIWHFVVLWHIKNVECRCTTTHLPLSDGIKIVSVIQHLHDEITHTISVTEKCDGPHTNKSQRFWSLRWQVKSEPPKVSMTFLHLGNFWGSDIVLPPGH